MGAPLDDARQLAQRYDRVRQEAEAQVFHLRQFYYFFFLFFIWLLTVMCFTPFFFLILVFHQLFAIVPIYETKREKTPEMHQLVWWFLDSILLSG